MVRLRRGKRSYRGIDLLGFSPTLGMETKPHTHWTNTLPLSYSPRTDPALARLRKGVKSSDQQDYSSDHVSHKDIIKNTQIQRKAEMETGGM